MRIERLDLRDDATAEELWALQHAAYRVEAALIGVADLPPLRDTVQTLRQCRETFFGCFNEDGELAGAVSYEEDPDGRYVICRMMVHPDAHRRGIATRLLQQVMSALPAGTEVSVTAESRNLPAVKLYEGVGFEAGEAFHPAPGIRMVRFRKRVP